MKIIKKRYFIVISIIIVLVFSVTAFGYYKKDQAKNLEKIFNVAINKSEYIEALKIYNNANEDKIIKAAFSFNKEAETLVKDVSNSLQNQYLDYKISFEEYEKKQDKLSQFQFLDSKKLRENRDMVANVEKIRKQFNECEAIYAKKEYANALEALDKFSTEDPKTAEKVSTLRTNIVKDYKDQVTKQIDEIVKNEKFQDAIKLLTNKKSIFSAEEINNKTNEINNLVKLKEEEEKKRIALEEEKRRQEAIQKEQAAIAVYLSGYYPNPDKENTVKDIESETKFLLTVDLNQQSTNVFIGKKGEWKLIKNIACSTGAPGYDTPKGSFKISSRGNWFFSEKYSEGAEYWTSFWGDYLFHSLPMNLNHKVIDGTLGKPASHGCVRMKIEDAKWIYNNISGGTKVIIR